MPDLSMPTPARLRQATADAGHRARALRSARIADSVTPESIAATADAVTAHLDALTAARIDGRR
ncbi:hypothetical protein [Streptomyces sp. cg36]|uniref:hypothetical protein n=1 Tax=Streptomyces sp. cg36 TaxID=3238798 RepID=UPI0034E30085